MTPQQIMTVRVLLRFIPHHLAPLILVAIGLSASPVIAAKLNVQPGRPNVVIIYADDLGYGDLSCYGHPRFKTPRIDRLATEGARLTHFYSICPYCAPSRFGLLTGRYPNRGDMLQNPAPDGSPKYDTIGIRDEELTLGELLKAAGYRTACVGKWHLGHKPSFMPTRHGFDEYFGILYSNDMRPVQLVDGEQVVEYPLVQATLTRRYTERCLTFLDQHGQQPFLLYVPQVMPHKPLAVSENFYQKSGAGLYGDALAELDWSVGQILDKLDALKIADRTLVFFSSDNGPWFGGSTGGLRGMKAQGFEGGIRVPFIARWPGVIPGGHTSDAPAAIIDVVPTVLKAVGIEPPPGLTLDGRDLRPVLTSSAPSQHEQLFSLNNKGVLTVRRGRWKLHVAGAYGRVSMPSDGSRWLDPRGPDGVTILAPYEQYQPSELPGPDTGDAITGPTLFNLASDPREQKNVAAQHPEIVAELLSRVEIFRRETPQPVQLMGPIKAKN